MTTPNYLPGASYYEEGHPQGEKMLGNRKYQIKGIALASGYSEDEVMQMAERLYPTTFREKRSIITHK